MKSIGVYWSNNMASNELEEKKSTDVGAVQNVKQKCWSCCKNDNVITRQEMLFRFAKREVDKLIYDWGNTEYQNFVFACVRNVKNDNDVVYQSYLAGYRYDNEEIKHIKWEVLDRYSAAIKKAKRQSMMLFLAKIFKL